MDNHDLFVLVVALSTIFVLIIGGIGISIFNDNDNDKDKDTH